MPEMERTYWVEDDTLDECVAKGRKLRMALLASDVQCEVGVVNDWYGAFTYSIILWPDRNQSTLDFSFGTLKQILEDSKIGIVLSACKLEVGNG